MNNSFISADEHVQEHPEVWTKRLSRHKWGERIPHVERGANGVERWVVDGRPVDIAGVADCGAAMAERTKNPERWSDVPAAVYDPKARLKAMDEAIRRRDSSIARVTRASAASCSGVGGIAEALVMPRGSSWRATTEEPHPFPSIG